MQGPGASETNCGTRAYRVGRSHVRTLMGKMGIEALYRKPRLTKTHPEHTIYPYLLQRDDDYRGQRRVVF